MPNQYTKVPLHLETQFPNDLSILEKQFTKAFFEILENKLPKNPQIIAEFINTLRDDLHSK